MHSMLKKEKKKNDKENSGNQSTQRGCDWMNLHPAPSGPFSPKRFPRLSDWKQPIPALDATLLQFETFLQKAARSCFASRSRPRGLSVPEADCVSFISLPLQGLAGSTGSVCTTLLCGEEENVGLGSGVDRLLKKSVPY